MPKEPDTRSTAERVRIGHAVDRLRGLLGSTTTAVSLKGPIGADLAQALMTTTSEIVMQIARHDAYLMYEDDASHRNAERPTPCGNEFLDRTFRTKVKKTCSEDSLCPMCLSEMDRWSNAQKLKAFGG